MDQCTQEVRAEYWRNIIKACGQCPAWQSAKKWMDENGICEQSYYHWQRKFRCILRGKCTPVQEERIPEVRSYDTVSPEVYGKSIVP